MSIVKSFSFPQGDIRGDTFYIKHNSDNFTMIDCYLKDGDSEDCRKYEIIDEIIRESEGRITRFISTHPDNDHIKGIEDLDRLWKIENFYAVANDKPADNNDPSLTKYQELLLKANFGVEKGISRLWLNKDSEEHGSSGIFFHWPVLENEKFKSELENVKKGGSPNNISCIFTYCVENGASYMWMGDIETKMMEVYFDSEKGHIPHADILFHPHHGRESAKIPSELLDAINPKLIVIGNAPCTKLDYGNSKMTITQNTSGDIIFVNDDNKVHVYTQNEIKNPPVCLRREVGKAKDSLFYVGSMTV